MSTSKLYDPDQSALNLTTDPWIEAFRTQRDVGLLIPVNFHVVPSISLRAACFANNTYEDNSFQTCFSNLLALGLRRFDVDVYWDQVSSQWSLCPAQIPPSGSAVTASATPLSSSFPSPSATGTLGVAAREAAMTTTLWPENGDLNIKPRQETPSSVDQPSPTSSTPIDSTAAPTPISPTTANGKRPLLQIGPYKCTSSMTLGYLTGIFANFLDATATTTDAGLTFLLLNIHAAAFWDAPDQPAPQPTQLPSPSNSMGDIIRGNLSNELYTPQKLQDQRGDLYNSWLSVSAANLPASGYYRTQQQGENWITEDGWPTEAFMEFRDLQRVITSFGYIDPQMSAYNISTDGDTIFPPGTIPEDHAVSLRSDGSVVSGCLFAVSESSITASTNSSWAIATAPSLNIGANPDLLTPDPAVTNLTSCGVSVLLNQTLANTTADRNPLPYAAFARSYLWTWAPGEPVNATSGNGTLARCAAMFTNGTYPGRWRTVDCTSNLRVACQDLSTPFRWEVSPASGMYASAESLCPDGLSFSVPHTSLENAHLLAAVQASSMRAPIFVNLNSLDVTDCWVAGTNSTCPYLPPADTNKARIVVVPTVAAVIIFVLAVLTFFVKCASNRREDMRGRRRRMVGGWEYEGVPS